MTSNNLFRLITPSFFALALTAAPLLADNIYIDNSEENNRQQTDTTQAAVPADTVPKADPYAEGDRVGEIDPVKRDDIRVRKESKRFSTAGFGPASMHNMADGLAYNFFAGHLWEVNPFAAIKTLGEVTSNFDNSLMVDMNLGANFYAMNTDISPYVGGGLGFGYGNGPDRDDAFGFNLGASIGALLFRTSSTQMNIEGKTNVLLANAGEGLGNPVVYAARLGVLF